MENDNINQVTGSSNQDSQMNNSNEGNQIDWSKERENLEKYVNRDRLSNSAIGEIYNVSPSTIARKLKLLGIEKKYRSNSYIRRNEMRDNEIIKAIKNNLSIASSLRALELEDNSGNREWLKRKIISLKLDTSHFTGQLWSKGQKIGNKCTKKIEMKDILVKSSTYQSARLRNRLLQDGFKEHKCECCGNRVWNNKPIPLELHHINGDHFDNRIENLQLLCPNCHAQTDNYCSKNKTGNFGGPKIKIPSAEELLSQIRENYYTYKVAKQYSVSDSIIRKWIKSLGIRDQVDKIRQEGKP